MYTREELSQKIQENDKTQDEMVTLFIELSYTFDKEEEYGEALKYASLATIVSDVPRADACCRIGDLYAINRQTKWAKMWYTNSIQNVSNEIDSLFYTWLPLQKMCQMLMMEGNFKEALKYVESALIFNPDDEECCNMKQAIENFLKE